MGYRVLGSILGSPYYSGKLPHGGVHDLGVHRAPLCEIPRLRIARYYSGVLHWASTVCLATPACYKFELLNR